MLVKNSFLAILKYVDREQIINTLKKTNKFEISCPGIIFRWKKHGKLIVFSLMNIPKVQSLQIKQRF